MDNSNIIETDNIANSLSCSPPQIVEAQQTDVLKKVKEIEESLKLYEIVAITFLLHTDARKAYVDLEHFLSGTKSNLIYNWCLEASKNDDNWENMIYESLFVIKNYKLLKYFNIEAVNAVHYFNHKYSIPDIRLLLFRVCENLVGSELEILLAKMGERDLRFRDYLEVYILKWISEKKISIDSKVDVKLLANSLIAADKINLTNQLLKYQDSSIPIETLTLRPHSEDFYTIIDPNNVGLCVIINQKKFTSSELRERKGTEKDCESLERMLTQFKFDIEIVNDVISTNVIRVIHDKIVNCFKPNHSIFMLIILSHGKKGVIYGTDSRPVEITRIDQCLLLPQLQGKPKVVIIQACQGDSYVKASNKLETDAPLKAWPKDTLFCMATIPNFASYRHIEKGTWYIQTLCEVFEKYPEENLYTLLNKVNGKLFNEPVFDTEDKICSIPEFHSRLDKNLFFKPTNQQC